MSAHTDAMSAYTEMVAAVNELLRRLTEARIALDAISEMGHGGCYGGECFCAENMRNIANDAIAQIVPTKNRKITK